ncbi:hypothetical protein HDU98_009201, partial [Podochytrium sp. JEL0797]
MPKGTFPDPKQPSIRTFFAPAPAICLLQPALKTGVLVAAPVKQPKRSLPSDTHQTSPRPSPHARDQQVPAIPKSRIPPRSSSDPIPATLTFNNATSPGPEPASKRPRRNITKPTRYTASDPSDPRHSAALEWSNPANFCTDADRLIESHEEGKEQRAPQADPVIAPTRVLTPIQQPQSQPAIKYNRILHTLMPTFTTLPPASRNAIKTAVKLYLETVSSSPLTFHRDCVIPDSISGETFVVPQRFVSGFVDWVARELRECFPEAKICYELT